MEMLAIYKGHSDAVEGVSQTTGNAWRKVTAIFETIEHYPKTIAVVCMNAMCETALQCKQGKLYRVRFDVESRSWTDPKTNQEKWFTDCKCWGIAEEVPAAKPGVQAQPQGTAYQQQVPPQARDFTPQNLNQENSNDDLPF